MHWFTILFIGILIAGLLLQLWLAGRQADAIRRHYDRVPDAFHDRIDLAAHQKAARYSLDRLRLERASLLFGALLALGWTLGGGIALLDGLWLQADLGAIWHGVALILSVLLIGGLLELPLDIWSTFDIETRHGFNRATPRRYLTDLGLQLLLTLALGVPLVALILWLMQEAGSWWWLAAWVVWMAFTLFISWAYPTILAPLFNKFTPLADRELRSRLEQLLERCGFSSDGMFVMDGSSRSSHGNAYFSGFGRSKRIVFFDTLLEGLEPAEIEAVLAHELGHFRRRHVLKGMLIMGAISLTALAVLAWLMQQPWFYQGLGVERMSAGTALSLFLVASPFFMMFLSPLFTALSRRHEFEADDFAAEQADAAALISGLVKMYRDNASTLTPDPLYSAFHHSHPPAPIRVAHLTAKLTA